MAPKAGVDPVAQFSYRDFIGAIVLRPRPTTFLADRMIGRRTTHRTKFIELDKFEVGNMIARYVARDGDATIVGKAGYDNLIHVAPYVHEKIPYTPSDVDTRLAGEDPYNPGNPIDQLVAGWLMDLQDRFVRLEEKQVAEAIQTGKLVVQGEGVDYEVDFQQDATNNLITLSGANRWSETTSTKLDNLATWAETLRNKGFSEAEFIMDRYCASYLLRDEEVQSMLDNKGMEIGRIAIRNIKEQKASYLGTLTWDGFDLDLYSYHGFYNYLNSSGTVLKKKYMNDYTGVMIGTGLDGRMHYGKIENFRAPNFMGSRFPYQYETEDGRHRYVATESSPMYGLHTPEAVLRAVVHS